MASPSVATVALLEPSGRPSAGSVFHPQSLWRCGATPRVGLANTVRDWARVRGAQVARLVYPTFHGRRSLMVGYLAGIDTVTLRLPSFVGVVNYLDGQTVVLEVAQRGLAPARLCGVAHVVANDTVAATTQEQLESWPAGILSYFVVIQPTTPAPSVTSPGQWP